MEQVLVYNNSTSVNQADIAFVEGRDVHWEDVIPSQSAECNVEWMDAEDPLFLLYTSGSTGEAGCFCWAEECGRFCFVVLIQCQHSEYVILSSPDALPPCFKHS